MDIGSIAMCEKHELLLDEHGECQLCRLSVIPSKQPPSRVGGWLGFALVVLVLGGGALAFAVLSRFEQAAPERGVPTRGAAASSAATAVREPPQHAVHLRESDNTEHTRSSIPVPPPSPTPEQIQDRRVEVAPPPAAPAERLAQRTITEEDAKAALSQVKIEMYATQWCGSCRRAREYLSHNEIAYTEYDIDEDEAAEERLAKINPRTSIPTFQIDDIVQIGFSTVNFEYRLNEAVRKRLD